MTMIRRILCCCGNGVGSSLMMQMTIEEALENLGADGIEVSFGSLTEASMDKADLFVVSKELLPAMSGLPVIGLTDLMNTEEAEELLKQWPLGI